METQFDIVCIGNICLDARMVVPELPKKNTKTRVKDYDLSCGGPAAVAAAVGAKHGSKAAFIGAVAKDSFGQFTVHHLNEFGVNTDYVTINENQDMKTAYATVLVSEKDGSRTIVSSHSSELKVTGMKSFSAKVLEFDGQEPEASFKAMEMNPNAITILDAGRVKKATIDLGKAVDYLVCSKDFAEDFVEEEMIKEKIELLNKKSPQMARLFELKVKLMKKLGIRIFQLNDDTSILKAYEIMEKTFPNNIVITLEDKGCAYKDKATNEIGILPTLNLKSLGLKVKDTTGAGDIFHGAFAHAIAMGMSLIEALKYANVVASLSVTEIGGITSIPDKDKVENVLRFYNPETIILNSKSKRYVHKAA